MAVKAVNVGSSASDSDMKKVLDECRRLQAEVSKLQAENAQIKVCPSRLRLAMVSAFSARNTSLSQVAPAAA